MLIEVVDVAVEDFDEEFHRYSGVHAGVGDAEGTLKTFEDALAVAVELWVGISGDGIGIGIGSLSYVLGVLAAFLLVFFLLWWEGLDWDRPP